MVSTIVIASLLNHSVFSCLVHHSHLLYCEVWWRWWGSSKQQNAPQCQHRGSNRLQILNQWPDIRRYGPAQLLRRSRR
ncbi:hypothetical protein K469DRAFT_365267 [Zopfia rhizophila CBS 207.26]|uniref:Secreted protein n=1 Tax=Zopfia rhizophila CBS 207.26 TaxID=1314779 RepID=A0A6A6EJL5_9PEZI|nr:hypothetical protein K469DRAFT_365267 [Zopfia rhizophila CBS 207.26]